jgi:AcrR family transcriptional regulator
MPDDTHARLLETAGRAFAEAGFQAAKVRDICARAKANLAAVNYHFGDKLGLYREVLRFAACETGIDDFDKSLPGRTPEERLRTFVRGLLQHIFGEDRPAWAVRLMTHELAQPTPLLDGVVDQMIRPRQEALRELIGSIIDRPRDDHRTRLCAQSVMGQVVVYAHGREVIKRLWPQLKFTPASLDEIADHIAAFSYCALQGLRRRSRRDHDRGRERQRLTREGKKSK